MVTKPIPNHPGAVIVDLVKYRKKLKAAARKPRRSKVPTYEILACENCHGSNFKFVLASDVTALQHSVICSDCQQPLGQGTLAMVHDLVIQQMVRR